ncbi:MAG: penicillin-binding protein 2 [Chloroflexi bacterium]|nr:penicillin-binding protein 2 [Chloroflexota bacterium]
MQQTMRPVTLSLRRRSNFAMLVVILSFCYLGYKSWYWQVAQASSLQQRAVKEHTLNLTIPASRGHIYDATGQTLATDADYSLIYAVPPNIKDPVGTAIRLSPILGVPERQLVTLLTPSPPDTPHPRQYSVLARKVPPATRNQVLKLRLVGIGVTPDETRIYPEGTLAAQVLGFVNDAGQGNYGLEQYYNTVLKGTPGKLEAERDGNGNELDLAHARYVPPVPGSDLYLTIDDAIQYDAERVLVEGIHKYGAKSGSVIVMNPHNGAILAMANYPTYDPNHYADASLADFVNTAITTPFEPGSTFKVVTMSIGIQTHSITPETTVYDPGYVKFYNSIIHDWDRKSHGVVTMRQVLDHSLNVGASFVARRVGAKNFYAGLSAFGLGRRTGIDLQGEAPGVVLQPDQPGWYPINLLTNSFGQGLTATSLQMADVVSVIANGGTLYKPYVVQRIVGPQGEKVVQPVVLGHPISPKTAATLRSMMEEVPILGEATLGRIPGYLIGAKTGTAQIAKNGVYEKSAYMASFVGFAPAQDPAFVLFIVLDHPTTSIYGANTAAPMFAELGQMILTHMGIPPTQPFPTPTPAPRASSSTTPYASQPAPARYTRSW